MTLLANPTHNARPNLAVFQAVEETEGPPMVQVILDAFLYDRILFREGRSKVGLKVSHAETRAVLPRPSPKPDRSRDRDDYEGGVEVVGQLLLGRCPPL